MEEKIRELLKKISTQLDGVEALCKELHELGASNREDLILRDKSEFKLNLYKKLNSDSCEKIFRKLKMLLIKLLIFLIRNEEFY